MSGDTDAQRRLHQLLARIYYGVGTNSFALSQNIAQLTSAAKQQSGSVGLPAVFVTTAKVRSYVRTQIVAQVYRPKRKRFRRSPYFSPSLNHCWLGDVGYLTHLSKKRTDPKYFLLVTDLFSRRLYGRLLRRITSAEVSRAFSEIAEESGATPVKFGSDQGKEFLGSEFQSLMHRLKIDFYSSNDPNTKISVIERAIRSVKGLLNRMVTADAEKRSFTELFPIVLYSLNNRAHSSLPKSIKFPAAVTPSNEHLVRQAYTERWVKMKKAGLAGFKFDLGDRVRIAKDTGPFAKGFKPGAWSMELYTVVGREGSIPARYRIADYMGAHVKGTFYAEELQKVRGSQAMTDKPYVAKQVLGRRVQRETGRAQVLVMLEGDDADARNAYWIDEVLVQLPTHTNKVVAKPGSPQQTAPGVAQRSPTQARRSGRVRRAPQRLDL